MGFSDKAVVVTGAGSGIGRTTAELFSKRGANVVIADIDKEAADGTHQLLQNGDGAGRSVVVETDVSDENGVNSMIETCVDEFGRIDVLHNNAGIVHKPTPLEDLDETTWDQVYQVNVKGVFFGVKAAIPHMRSQNEGVIVNTASSSAIRPRPLESAYATSKGAIVTLTKQLALELASDQIRVNAVCPVATNTPLLRQIGNDKEEVEEQLEQMKQSIPLGRLVEPDEVAQTVAYLASEEADMITGTALEVDGGNNI